MEFLTDAQKKAIEKSPLSPREKAYMTYKLNAQNKNSLESAAPKVRYKLNTKQSQIFIR